MRLLSRLRRAPRPSGPKISVVVPVFNTGEALDELVRSLEGQSMPAADFEVVFVDDGSTDGTAERLDALAGTHGNFVVHHIPNSGWPGTPRNVGLGAARGEYVAFVDHDDYLGPRGLELVHAFAVEHRSDVVIAREVGVGRSIGRFVFRRTIPDARLDEDPVVQLLTPHKIYRRAMLESHRIRFPPGKVRLEDHQFNVQAFFAAERISIYADYAYYHWTRRAGVVSASSERFDPHAYFATAVNAVLDVVDRHTEPGERRDRIKAYWLGKKVLMHLSGRAMLGYSSARREQVFREVHAVAVARFTPETVDHLEFSMRVRAHLVREQRLDLLLALAEAEAGLTATVLAEQVWYEEGAAAVRFSMELRYGDGSPVLFRRAGDSVVWVPPLDLGALPRSAIDVTADLLAARLHLLVRRRDAPEDHSVCAAGAPRLVPVDGVGDRLVFSGVARLDGEELRALPGATGPVVVDVSAELDALGRRVTRRVAVPAQGVPARPATGPELYTTQLGNLSIRVRATGADLRPARCSVEAHSVAGGDPGPGAVRP
ncbi:Glycosyltransferase involved in cell wall bisynthesis [Friedmanniella luteola]|uniref:Glycosyltransferase involved in cell wall bisynthesis n=1 Tax=Friedmanniella luteola TaxID=546871 RepID=A0A1H1U1F9_9ACTN|nr:glycosyltransferase [Friedmanniella luteola]SDS66223.1 Glycosyltransferase involved in cell wall bisynthesis [Friedmanniella luteola]